MQNKTKTKINIYLLWNFITYKLQNMFHRIYFIFCIKQKSMDVYSLSFKTNDALVISIFKRTPRRKLGILLLAVNVSFQKKNHKIN